MGWNNNTEKRIDLKVAAAGWLVGSFGRPLFSSTHARYLLLPTPTYLPTYLNMVPSTLPNKDNVPFFNHPIQIQAPTNSHTTYQFRIQIQT